MAEFLDEGAIELEFGDVAAGNAFFTFDDTFEPGQTNFEVTGFILEVGSLQNGTFGEWAFEAVSDFGRVEILVQEPVSNPGEVDAIGNTQSIQLGNDADADGIADTITVIFNGSGDVDDINGFGSLEPLSSPPPAIPDIPLPDPLLSISDLKLTQTDTNFVSPSDTLLAEYELAEDWVVNSNLVVDNSSGNTLISAPGFISDPLVTLAGYTDSVTFVEVANDGNNVPIVNPGFEDPVPILLG